MVRRVLSHLCAPVVPLLVVLLSASSVVRSMPPSARKKHNSTLRMARKEGAKRARLDSGSSSGSSSGAHLSAGMCSSGSLGGSSLSWSLRTAVVSKYRFGNPVLSSHKKTPLLRVGLHFLPRTTLIFCVNVVPAPRYRQAWPHRVAGGYNGRWYPSRTYNIYYVRVLVYVHNSQLVHIVCAGSRHIYSLK